MAKPFDVTGQLATFTGQARLFPLPNVVLFPHLLLPLHIFEQRYRRMVEDALGDDRLIAMALLKPGSDPMEPSPPIHDTVCLGRIKAEQRLDDGRYYLVLQGLSRARIMAEQICSDPYRVADLQLEPENETPSNAEECTRLAHIRLIQAFRELFPRDELDRAFRNALNESVPLGLLCDVLADALSLEPQVAYQVLAERSVERRSRLVLRLIHEKLREQGVAPRGTWPPRFSLN